MLALILFAAFVVVPIAEIFIILQVSEVIGGWQTVGLLVAEMLFGGWIVRREGRRAWRALNEALLRGLMPDRELADAALVLVGGTLLLTPGFLTDIVGFVFVLPPTRPLVRRLLAMYVARRVQVARTHMGTPFGGGGPADTGQPGERAAEAGDEHRVIRGEVVDEDGDDRRDPS
jgi:UPF0716 protein FxsA